ncbi:hypothetical protein HMPREF9080_00941 [Cardiobacterium valvarum F0432]|uniref:Uncharacterized protein n=1 Tax=Cardiobacterium valvarum F0432 TaxID=797473 RepID=G9ZDV7_9GAMM|nr:hypothetical protein HMPREF9080_00941 [Cardiobacterium valvarum F0432]
MKSLVFILLDGCSIPNPAQKIPSPAGGEGGQRAEGGNKKSVFIPLDGCPIPNPAQKIPSPAGGEGGRRPEGEK